MSRLFVGLSVTIWSHSRKASEFPFRIVGTMFIACPDVFVIMVVVLDERVGLVNMIPGL